MNEIYEYAKKYRAIGWNVIPLYHYSKNPFPLQWKQFQERLSTDEEFKQWFTTPHLTGLGLITGKISGIVVLDEDTYKEGGIRVKAKTGMYVKTARGGTHHYFKYVEPIRSSGLREGIYVEIKADGGFVVMPPSQVRLDDGSIGTYTWEDKCMPDDLLPITEAELAPYRAGKEGERVNIMELRGASFGTQHNSLRSIALAVLNRFPQKEWKIAEDVIRVEAEKFDPPHPIDRVEKMIIDCEKFVRNNPKETVEKEIAREPVLPRKINDMVEEVIEDRRLAETAPKTGWPELDTIIRGFVPKHTITFTGDTNVGKTTIACNFAEALRRQNRKTLYIALEPDVDVVQYLASVRHKKKFRQLTDEDLYIHDDEDYIQVFLQRDNIREVKDLIRALENIPHFDLIIIDHIGYFVHSERDWLQQQANVVKELAFLSKAHRTAVMLIAHLRKPTTASKKDWIPSQNDISGSGAFKQDSTEVLIAFRPKKEGDLYSLQFADKGVLLVSKTKAGPEGFVPLYFEPGCAKVWSEQEALNDPEGKAYLLRREQEHYQVNMDVSRAWLGDTENTLDNDE